MICALDIGAHWGEIGLDWAREHPDIPVYAFEPMIRDAARIVFSLPNYHVIAAAINETDGIAPMMINRVPGCHSLHRQDGDGLTHWPGGRNFAEVGRVLVPTLRLDTFLGLVGVSEVVWLKVDTQAHDLAVLRSLGAHLADVQTINIEICAAERGAYEDTPRKAEIVAYLNQHGFYSVRVKKQTRGFEENWTFTRDA